MNLLNGLLVVFCLVLMTTANENRLRGKHNSPLATLQRFSPSIFGRSELAEEETDPTTYTSPLTDITVTTAKPVTKYTGELTTKIPKHEDNLGIAKFLDSLNFDHVDKAFDNLNIPEFKKLI